MAAPRKSPIIALLVALSGLAVAVFVGTQNGSDVTTPAAPSVSASVSTSAVGQSAAVPRIAWATLTAIDAGRWPPDDAPGTQGGRSFGNHEGRLPATGGGQKVRYQEWDVNRKQSGRGRDAERIVTGSDGSAWYTDDHYETFVRMR
ncbi:guanyl-specific ribonuclease Sa [Rhodococcus sp. OK519]|uniref:ribonuclease domain-containing protein n=1 Tax=Rhodococcus sp. OK519 TaxID=2135729 RepID=UPI000D37C848|nr:guanyl-specific ribonuclease Sa [Rhodococcus sp. OK519]